ncbi:DNA-binding transcriptional regulator [Commensalibacter communis]|uniref:LysR family (LysR) n=1 Tax=Commensalibacter communis TaxID=2972786 RepID=A0A9W4TNY7_9PROT|nr:LysR family transcriptional regulator [Commensalibacter communis]CAI3947563.1 DNA-binding transcriptional regulator [Commensalibacter communis]CAI3948041.1 DNA-binding transcriptional regulator [Commensalibacter communis]CAI3949877.1 DNA-binding transcriptional regulator [Commensalibacter communis]CAI3950834.1 DNA-binding transcriptional regulator [Commensalibacter communis]CAI3951230.1 DNA-binding transcriptional regulator [Commensalibacter communis]
MDNIRSLDFNLLKVMDALLDERNVTRAAKKLSLTQPAVSIMLNRLRDKFNDPLFVRASHGMVPTDRALSLSEPIKKILLEINLLMQPTQFNPSELKMTFTIAANDNDMMVTGIPFVMALKQQAPNVKVAFVSYHKLDVQLMLERGELDILLTDPYYSPEFLYQRVLYQERYVCVMRKDHPLAQLKQMNLEDFCNYEHVLVSHHGGQFCGVTDTALKKLGLNRKVALSITSFLLLPCVLEQSNFIAVAPERVVKKFTNMITVDAPIEIQGFTKIIAWHERNHRDPRQQWLRQLIANISNEA